MISDPVIVFGAASLKIPAAMMVRMAKNRYVSLDQREMRVPLVGLPFPNIPQMAEQQAPPTQEQAWHATQVASCVEHPPTMPIGSNPAIQDAISSDLRLLSSSVPQLLSS
mmetsp:Transcript_44945/g.70463  ORF Transcript_44945/g.70463 Transcript_44945/m.70463 type:complete len:110 (-) Transcript_44945:96-425(-)